VSGQGQLSFTGREGNGYNVPRRYSVTNKQIAIQAVKELPDEATLEDIAERLAILAAIRKAEQAADAGRVVSHEEMQRRTAQWASAG
jgi:predicted transcriptional regulator